MVKRTNRIVLWILSTVTVVVLMFGYHTSTEGPEAAATPAALAPASTADSSGTTSGSASDAAGGSGSTSGDTSGDAPSSGADTGDQSAASATVTGDAEDTQWGQVQVELTISDGKITDVEVPVYPDGNGRDQEINSYALPQLISETISAQSASIDMVSGATVTSDGYLRSLQSALDKAGL